MSNTGTRKPKKSVNPAKNAELRKNTAITASESKSNKGTPKTDTKQEIAEPSRAKKNSSKKSAKTEEANNLDGLKNWKTRRQIKKALNTVHVPNKKQETPSKQEDVSEKLKKHSKKNKEIVDDKGLSHDDKDLNEQELALSEENFEEDLEQEYAPDQMEQLKSRFHSSVGRAIRKIFAFLFAFVKRIALSTWKFIKSLTPSQVVFFAVSILIILAFVVPPIISAVEMYRSGAWSIFG